MASDPTKPLLRLAPQAQVDRPVGRQRNIPRPDAFPQDRQRDLLAPKFDRLAQVLARDPAGLELRRDPTALAPERILVFEVRGSLSAFAAAVARIPGLELVDEEELPQDGTDEAPIAYLLMPDMRALRELESLWRRWLAGQIRRGETIWRDVFSLLRDLRTWGPQDRMQPTDISALEQDIDGLGDDDLIKLEIELVFRANDRHADDAEQGVRAFVEARGGRIVSRARIVEIAYHAMLAQLAVRHVREATQHAPAGIAGLDAVMHIRAQSVATRIELSEAETIDPGNPVANPGAPILAILDGVPIAAHRLLGPHIVVDDQFQLEPRTPVGDRNHGTAMASLVIHGDRNKAEPPLPRQVHVVPVLGPGDRFPEERLIVDLIYAAVMAMRSGNAPTAPGVVIVNMSLGNRRRVFQGQLSPWARLLDRLAYRFGILFLVSAGNVTDRFPIAAFAQQTDYEDAEPLIRAQETLRAVNAAAAIRRLLSPAETVNGVTVGAGNEDAVPVADRVFARVIVDPYPEIEISNPSSALGPGFALAVKPDILMPGAREHLRVVSSNPVIEVVPSGPSRAAGLRVAAPPSAGRENVDGYTNGTSAAAALAARTCHRIHDALEAAYGNAFLNLSHLQRAVLLKALLVHPAKWHPTTAELIREIIGPADGKQHVRQKDNIRRFLGFGRLDSDDAIACAADRATFWAVGALGPNKITTVQVPVPQSLNGQARPHAMSATLAWFTPVSPGRKSYRSVRLRLIEPDGLDRLTLSAHKDQPDANQTNRGTVFTRCWMGDRAPVVGANATIDLVIQRDPDQSGAIDDAVPFGLAVTLAVPGLVQLYEQVRQRIAIAPRVAI